MLICSRWICVVDAGEVVVVWFVDIIIGVGLVVARIVCVVCGVVSVNDIFIVFMFVLGLFYLCCYVLFTDPIPHICFAKFSFMKSNAPAEYHTNPTRTNKQSHSTTPHNCTNSNHSLESAIENRI